MAESIRTFSFGRNPLKPLLMMLLNVLQRLAFSFVNLHSTRHFKVFIMLLEYSENIELVVARTYNLITAWTFFRKPENGV